MALGFFNPMLQRPLNNPNFRVIEREEEMIVRKKTLCMGFNVPNFIHRIGGIKMIELFINFCCCI
jgi:hypothetical protein